MCKTLTARGYTTRGPVPERQHFPRVEVAPFGWLSQGASRVSFEAMCHDGSTDTFIMQCGTRAIRVNAMPEDYR